MVVIGNQMAEDNHKSVGSSITLNGKKFIIKGIFTAKSDLLENIVIMSLDDVREIVPIPKDKIALLEVEPENLTDDKKLVTLINLKYSDLDAKSSSDLSEQFDGILGSFRSLVFVVAGLSALVAGVGIINVMLMSVLERFKEIGALKAVGWTESDVLNMILIESILIGIIGGVFGLILGYFASNLAGNLLNIPPSISIELLALTFLFAVSVGFIAGLYPAHYASKMDPIQALRTD